MSFIHKFHFPTPNPDLAEPQLSLWQKAKLILSLLALAALAAGCAAASAVPLGSLIGNPNASALEIHQNTEARLEQGNFVLVRTNVVGQCSGFSLLGVITIVPARVTKAMNRLYTQADMHPGHSQTLVNLIMESSSSYFILFSIPRTSVRADVIEFLPSSTLPTNTPTNTSPSASTPPPPPPPQ